VLRAVEVTKRYDRDGLAVDALRGVDLEIGDGELVAIMGPSGCGKSTLLHVLGALDTPTSGTVEVDGRSLAGITERERTDVRRHRIGFVFQFFNLVPVLTVRENVLLPGVIDGMGRSAREERADELLGTLGLGAMADRLPSRLSGGQQQRVAIARALFHRPTVILADEPTGNLDRRSGMDVLDVLSARHEEGNTIMLATHDPTVAARAQRVVFLRDGVVVEELVPTGVASITSVLDRLDADVEAVTVSPAPPMP
jgi:putative ABC transport system ATP-binding protein